MKTLFKKLFCLHNWKIISSTHFKDCDKHLLKCVKCEKLKKEKMKRKIKCGKTIFAEDISETYELAYWTLLEKLEECGVKSEVTVNDNTDRGYYNIKIKLDFSGYEKIKGRLQ